MEQWSPNPYLKNGLSNGFNPEYLHGLVRCGKRIKSKHKPVIFTLGHLANRTNIQTSELYTLVSRHELPQGTPPYRTSFIKKRKGGSREINAPCTVLRIVQDWINRNILQNLPVHESATAFNRNGSIVKNAKPHCQADWLLKMDIEDFFGNINEKQVFKLFRSLRYAPLLSFEMARLCTFITESSKSNNTNKNYKITNYSSPSLGVLPQGAPTSPALSNLVCIELDKKINSLCLSEGVTYTRYADDLTFSFVGTNRDSIVEFKGKIERVLVKHGFQSNKKKMKIVPPGARKIVTGLIVNGAQPTIPRDVRDKIRSDLYYCRVNGIHEHCKANKYKSIVGFINHMSGMIAFVNSVDKNLADKYWNEFNKLDMPNLLLK